MSQLRKEQKETQRAVNSPVNQQKFLVTRAQLAADQEPFYNVRSQIILIRDANGNLHRSQLAGENVKVTPNPELHDVLWFHMAEEEAESIADAPTNYVEGVVQGLCLLIPKLDRDPHVEPANTSLALSRSVRDSKAQRTTIPGPEGTGISIGQEEGNVYIVGSGGTELVVADDGIYTSHQIDSTDMRKKGFFVENPLSSVVPETIITFPFSMKELPDPQRIENIAGIVSDVMDTLKTLKSLEGLLS